MASFHKNRKSFSLCKPIKSLSLDVRHSIRSGVNISTVTQCVEELVLNSIDANATSVSVRLDLVDFKLRVEDNGTGLRKEDLGMIGQRHSTSKCTTLQDLTQLRHYGFRGEALASIIDMSTGVEFYTKSKDEIDTGPYYRKYKNGKPLGSIHSVPESKKPTHGLTIVVHGLLSKFPVRQNRIETPVELEEIKKCLEHIYLVNPQLSIELRNDSNGKILLSTGAVPSTSDAFKSLYLQRLGKSHSLHEVFFNFDVYVCKGWFSTSTHQSKSLQLVYINKRFLTRNKIHRYLHDTVHELLGLNKSNSYSPRSSEKHPIFLVNISCGFTEVDLTVDPKKTIVEFKDWNKVMKAMEGLVQVFQVELLKENKSVLNRSNVSKLSEPGGIGFYDKGNHGAGNFRSHNLSTREVKRAIHSRVVLREGGSRSPKFDSDVEDTPPQRNIKALLAQRRNRPIGKDRDRDTPSPVQVPPIPRKMDKYKIKEKLQVPARWLNNLKRKVVDYSPKIDQVQPRQKASKYITDEIYNPFYDSPVNPLPFERSNLHKEPHFDSDVEFSPEPAKRTPENTFRGIRASRLLPDDSDLLQYVPVQRKVDAFKKQLKPRISPIKNSTFSPRNKIIVNFGNPIQIESQPAPVINDVEIFDEIYQEIDSHLKNVTSYIPHLQPDVLQRELMLTSFGKSNLQELNGVVNPTAKENTFTNIKEDVENRYEHSPYHRNRVNTWVETTMQFQNNDAFSSSDKQTPPPSPDDVSDRTSKLHISEHFLTPPENRHLQQFPNFQSNQIESQDLISYSQQEQTQSQNDNIFAPNQGFEFADFIRNDDHSLFKNIFGTIARPLRNIFDLGIDVQVHTHVNQNNCQQTKFPIPPVPPPPQTEFYQPIRNPPPQDSELFNSQYFTLDNSNFQKQDFVRPPPQNQPFSQFCSNFESGRGVEEAYVHCTIEDSFIQKDSSPVIEQLDRNMNGFITTPIPEPPDQNDNDDATWGSWTVEVSTDKEGTEWLKGSDSRGVPVYFNTTTGAESYDMRNVINTRVVSGNEVKKLRSNWLRRYYPKGSQRFWSPRNMKSSLVKDGNIELVEKGNTIFGSAVQQCITGAMDSLIMEKWREGCYKENLGKQIGPVSKESNPGIFVSEYWERPNDPVELPILNLNAPEISFGSNSKQFFSCRISKEDLQGVKVISQLDKKFIVAKLKLVSTDSLAARIPEILVLFDQHAVHERIRLETLVNDIYTDKEGKKVICSVNIVPPFQLHLTESEVRLIGNYQMDFEVSGLSIEIVGLETVRVHTAPKCFAEKIANEVKYCRDDTMNRLIQMLLDEQIRHILDTKGTLHQMPKTIFNVLCSQACRGAIKFGDQLSREACEELIEKLKLCKMPFQCAHGRPSIAPLFDLKSILPTETYS